MAPPYPVEGGAGDAISMLYGVRPPGRAEAAGEGRGAGFTTIRPAGEVLYFRAICSVPPCGFVVVGDGAVCAEWRFAL